MSDIKVKTSNRNDIWSSAWMIPEIQVHYDRDDSENREHFFYLIQGKKNHKRNNSIIQPNNKHRTLSGQKYLKAIMGGLSHSLSEEKLEWRLLNNHSKFSFSPVNTIDFSPPGLKVRIENTRLNGCDILLQKVMKNLEVAFFVNNKEQFELVEALRTLFVKSLRQSLPYSEIDLSVSMAETCGEL